MPYTTYALQQWKQWLLLVPVLLLLNGSDAAAQSASSPPPSQSAEIIYQYVEQMPVYPGGPTHLLKDLIAEVNYPNTAKPVGLSGKVLVDFVVGSNGVLRDVKLNTGVAHTTGQEAAANDLNEAGVQAVRNLKKRWTPGRQNGKKVAVSYTVPIQFQP